MPMAKHQQCIEESLNADIEENEIGSVRIHNLERLFEIIAIQIKLDVDPVLVAMLDKLCIDARHPGDSGLLPRGKRTLDHTARFHALAKSIRESILAHPKPSKGS